jgi:hypothetical protein
MHEYERTQHPKELQKAKAAIFLRLKAKATRPPGIAERVALNDALLFLRALRGEDSCIGDSQLEHPRRLPMIERRERSKDEISHVAYALYLQRGAEPGNDVEDWLRAEKELAEPIDAATSLRPAPIGQAILT